MKNLEGKRYGLLFVEKRLYRNKYTFYLCRCDCGGIKITTHSLLQRGDVKSCGCIKRGGSQYIKHGYYKNPAIGRAFASYLRRRGLTINSSPENIKRALASRLLYLFDKNYLNQKDIERILKDPLNNIERLFSFKIKGPGIWLR